MKIWTLQFDHNIINDFPQVLYKGFYKESIETKLINELFRIFYLTHRDKKNEIKIIENYKDQLPYKDLYELVFPPKIVEFQTEYLIDLLNLFQIELEYI